MLHELLFALNGHSGHVFTQDSDTNTFKVNSSLDWFHPAEVGILNRLLELGTCVANVEAFVRGHRNNSTLGHQRNNNQTSTRRGESLSGGLYLEALCDGLESALRPYKLTLAAMEKEILRTGAGQNTQLSSIQHQVMGYQPMLKALSSLVDQIQVQRPHGCLILDTVYRASLSGVARVREAHQQVLHHCHKVFYKQLLAWVLKGDLHDPFHEFIIDQVPICQGNLESDQAGDAASVASNEESSSRSMIGGGHSSIGSSDFLHSRSSVATTSSSAPVGGTGTHRWRLRADRIPSHISYPVAEKIFFIGESIQLFDSGGADNADSSQKDVLRDDELQLYNQLSELRDRMEFRVADFERFVDSVRDTVSRHLHGLILEKADLKQELHLVVRDIFLLGRGELFQVFIEEADRFLKNPPTAATQHDVNEAFAMACRLACPGGADENILRKIKVKVTLKTRLKLNHVAPKAAGSGVGAGLTSGWDCLSVQYAAPWPLHLILTPSNIDTYNELLKMFLRVRRVQKLLQESWFADVKSSKKRNPERGNPDQGGRGTGTGAHQLRAHMLFVVNNLQHYLMVDVLEAQYSQLIGRLDRSTNFEEIRHAHDVFVNSVVAFTFVRNETISQCLAGLLTACQNYCGGEAASRQLDSISQDFARQSNLLFKILSTIQGRQTGSQLAQLLLRIDYNSYFSKHGHVAIDCS